MRIRGREIERRDFASRKSEGGKEVGSWGLKEEVSWLLEGEESKNRLEKGKSNWVGEGWWSEEEDLGSGVED